MTLSIVSSLPFIEAVVRQPTGMRPCESVSTTSGVPRMKRQRDA
jgi:hypothetical protein